MPIEAQPRSNLSPSTPGIPDAATQERHRKFVAEFAKESDRAAVIIGAAKLDNLLYQLLQSVLLAAAGSQDELLDGDSPLGTFSSRINMTYRLGLIDNDVSRALHLIRKIRNSFAHEVSGGDLQGGGHADRIRDLASPFKSRASDARLCFVTDDREGYARLVDPAANPVAFAAAVGVVKYYASWDESNPIVIATSQGDFAASVDFTADHYTATVRAH